MIYYINQTDTGPAVEPGKILEDSLSLSRMAQWMSCTSVASKLGDEYYHYYQCIRHIAGLPAECLKNNLQIFVAILKSIYYYWK